MAQTVERTCYRHPNRVTGLSCSDCGRPICTECMTPAPVGLRCPDHSGKPQGLGRVRAAGAGFGGGTVGFLTRILIGINVLVYAAELATGADINGNTGWIFRKFALISSGIESQDSLLFGRIPKGIPDFVTVVG